MSTTRAERIFYNVPMTMNHAMAKMELSETLGVKTTHRLVLLMHQAWLTVFLLENQLFHLDITGPPSTGKSMTAELLKRMWPDVVRACTKVTEGANFLPGDEFRIDLTHEMDRATKQTGNSTKLKSTIDAGKLQRTESVKQDNGTWRPQVVNLAQNVVHCDLGNVAVDDQDMDDAVATRFHFVKVATQKRKDDAIPRIGCEIGNTAAFALVRSQYSVRVARSAVILLIAGTLSERQGSIAWRVFNYALQKLDPHTVYEKFRGIKRVNLLAQTLAAERIGQLLFDIKDKSPFYGRPYGFNDLFRAVIRCYYVDIDDLVFAVTLADEETDDDTMECIRLAVMKVCFQQADRPNPRGTQPACHWPYVMMRYSPRVRAEPEAGAGAGAAAAAAADEDREDREDREAFDDVMGTTDFNRVAWRLPGASYHQPITVLPASERKQQQQLDQKENNNGGQRLINNADTWATPQRVADATRQNVRLLVNALYEGAREHVGRLPQTTLVDRLMTATKVTDNVIVSGRVGQPGVRYDRVQRVSFVHGNVVFSKMWLSGSRQKSIADHVLETLSFAHAPPEQVFVTGRQDATLPMFFKLETVRRTPGKQLVLPPINDVDPAFQARVARGVAPDAWLEGDNPYLHNTLLVQKDLHTAARDEHMRINGWREGDLSVGDLDLSNVTRRSFWDTARSEGECLYPPPPPRFGHGLAQDDTVVMDDLGLAAVDLLPQEETRAAWVDEMDLGGASAARGGDDALPPLEYRNEVGPMDFSAFLAPRPVLEAMSGAGPSEPRRRRAEESPEVRSTRPRVLHDMMGRVVAARSVEDLF